MIIIVADLSCLRGFRIATHSQDQLDPQPSLHEIDLPPLLSGPQRLHDTVSDQAGRFRSDGSPGLASGEAHGLELEQEKRHIASVARSIEALLEVEAAKRWALAAPKAINARIIECLSVAARDGLRQNLLNDLCKQPVLEIQKRFDLTGLDD